MNRFRTWRWPIGLVILTVLLLGASGCAGGVRATSWTGMTLVGERLYVADVERVVVLDATSGEPGWGFPEDPQETRLGAFQITPAVDEKRVIVASQVPPAGFLGSPQNIVWALDSNTGEELWRFDEASGEYVEGGAIAQGLFVVGNSDGNVYALDVDSGTRRWVFETGHRVWATPLIVSDTVYIGSMDRHLYALNLSDGVKRWDFHAQGAFASTPALRGDTLYIGAFDDRFYAIDARTGTERWHFSGQNWFWGNLAVHDNVVYAADVDGNVYAVDAESGQQIWHQALVDDRRQNEPVRAGPVLSEDGSRLFVGTQNGTLYALDAADGFVVWSQDSEGQMLSQPVVDGSVVYEMLIYGSYRVRARHVDNGREIWVYQPTVEEE